MVASFLILFLFQLCVCVVFVYRIVIVADAVIVAVLCFNSVYGADVLCCAVQYVYVCFVRKVIYHTFTLFDNHNHYY